MTSIFKSIVPALFLALMLAVSPAWAEAPKKSGGKKPFTISREMFMAFQAAPKASARQFFEEGAKAANRMVDRNYAHLAKEERPYLSPRRLAEVSDAMIKGYRAGYPALAEELVGRIPAEATFEEKIDLLERLTNIYLESGG